MKGITEGPHDRHVSRHEHAMRRQRGPSGRFLRKGDQPPPEAEQDQEENVDDLLTEDNSSTSTSEGTGEDDKTSFKPPTAQPPCVPSKPQAVPRRELAHEQQQSAMDQTKQQMLEQMYATASFLAKQQMQYQMLEQKQQSQAHKGRPKDAMMGFHEWNLKP